MGEGGGSNFPNFPNFPGDWVASGHMVSVELDVSQASVFRIERQEALYLPALSDYVSALGGELEINAVFPDGKVTLVPVEG